jgi:hypothetical protein
MKMVRIVLRVTTATSARNTKSGKVRPSNQDVEARRLTSPTSCGLFIHQKPNGGAVHTASGVDTQEQWVLRKMRSAPNRLKSRHQLKGYWEVTARHRKPFLVAWIAFCEVS